MRTLRRRGIMVKENRDGELFLSINGTRIDTSQTQIALLTLLLSSVGRVVPYKEICLVIGHSSIGLRQKHILLQYLSWLRRALAAHRVPYVLAVAPNIGYALCERAAKRGIKKRSIRRRTSG